MKPFVTKMGEFLVLMAGGNPVDFKDVICTAANCKQFNHGVIIMAQDKEFHTRNSQITKLLKYVLAVDKDDARRLRVAVKTLHIALVRGEQQARAHHDTVISNIAPKDVATQLSAHIVGSADPETDYHVREIKLGTDVQSNAHTVFYLLHEPPPAKSRKLRKLADVIDTPDSDSQAAQAATGGRPTTLKCEKTSKPTQNATSPPGIVLSPDDAATPGPNAPTNYDPTVDDAPSPPYEATETFDPETSSPYSDVKPGPDALFPHAAARATAAAPKGPRGTKTLYGDT
ncbi:hypothetical protein KFL_001880140 [Klebsormidium nitens]|uniref:Uncharacterized protein n=1 Tax=Klebsormidium nitens TaxID=105231 RepID=A0A1Y1I0F4_KLENI|nr:hypothetical protein KFL_001880140 [Klebsormidium nitens]|eukprot:GAQ84420.1 hypothetical protein KFL_001880140 [Klebsormidium nitens]